VGANADEEEEEEYEDEDDENEEESKSAEKEKKENNLHSNAQKVVEPDDQSKVLEERKNRELLDNLLAIEMQAQFE